MQHYGQFAELFLTPIEKENFARWHEEGKGVVEYKMHKSVVARMTDPLFERIHVYIPDYVSPNVLTLIGTVAVMQAWYFCRVYYNNMLPIAVFAAVGTYWVLHNVEKLHAKRTMQDTTLGEFFKYACDTVTTVFACLCFIMLFGGYEQNSSQVENQWYAVQCTQLALMYKHMSAFFREGGLRYWIFGPPEVITVVMGAFLCHALFGLRWFWDNYCFVYQQLCSVLGQQPGDPASVLHATVRLLYVTAFVAVTLKALTSKSRHHQTKTGVALCLACRHVPTVLHFASFHFLDIGIRDLTHQGVITDGLMMGVVTCDLMLAKMANRELHPWVILFAFSTIVPHAQFLVIYFIAFYYVAVFGDLCWFLNLPLFQTIRNVYCDGVYDLNHVGHKHAFRNALKHGNRLFVGVMSDEDCANYKRPPIMSAAERCEEVGACKAVAKVIPRAPCFGLTEEFIKKHSIHVVCFGEEYKERYPNPEDDPYYGVPRRRNMAVPLPRTPGLSTSDLIDRVQKAPPPWPAKIPESHGPK
mmetsp:Transcript_10500/g.23120  ORF Transcript_10500/g.23120 Transcript_10500/m.23120 type:complete len:526 (+) Transcript_10500:115-1692(+)